MAYVNPFAPNFGSNIVAASGIASATVSIAPGDNCIRLVNTGTNVCYVRVGTGTIAATTADLAVRGGSEVIIRKALGYDKLAHISALTTTLNIQTGNGGV
tara:strand:- start:962 stop:1261 length:300 start_codon:yes stop_codon:yes gene_type:complete